MTRAAAGDDPGDDATAGHPTRRLIALGASNLTRGFRVAVETTRRAVSGPIEVFAALGHGRSYGMRNRVLIRALPGILESRLWSAVEERPPLATTAVVTDIGNDVLYGTEPAQILEWVDDCLVRLKRMGARLVITDLPIFNTARLSEWGFVAFRSVIVPACRLSLSEVAARGEVVNEGVAALAERHGANLVRLRPEWYGIDPIHVLPRFWRSAWQEIVLAGLDEVATPPHRASPLEWLRLYLARPEQRWVLGWEQRCRQPAVRLADGTAVWIY